MPWLRLDDTFAEHRKIVALKRTDRWTWVELLTYCARQTNGGRIPHGITDVLRWVTPAFLDQCTAIGLIDKQPDGTLTIHDWDDYNPLRIDDGELEQRVADALADHPEASANEVHRIVGGRKQAVLAIVKRFRPVPPQVPGTRTERHPEPVPGTDREPVTRAAARARPVPTPPLEEQHQQQNGYLDAAAAAAAAAEELATAGWSDTQIPADPDELYRALAWLRYAANDPTSRNPAGLAYSKFKSGTWAPLPAKPGRSVQTHPECPQCGVSIMPPTTVEDHLRNVHDVHAGPTARARTVADLLDDGAPEPAVGGPVPATEGEASG